MRAKSPWSLSVAGALLLFAGAANAANTVAIESLDAVNGHLRATEGGTRFRATYTLNDVPAGQQIRVRVLACAPLTTTGRKHYNDNSPDSGDAGLVWDMNFSDPARGCTDDGIGWGKAVSVSTPPVSAGAQGVSGAFNFGLAVPMFVIPNGTQATVPVEAIDLSGNVIASASLTLTLDSHEHARLEAYVGAAQQLSDGSTNVTFRSFVFTDANYTNPDPSHDLTLSVATPPGAKFVSAVTTPTSTPPFNLAHAGNWWPILVPVKPNTIPGTDTFGFAVVPPPPGDGGIATATIHAPITYHGSEPLELVYTYNYAPGTPTANFLVNSDRPSGDPSQASAHVDIGPVSLDLQKYVHHYTSLVPVTVVGGGTALVRFPGQDLQYAGVLYAGNGLAFNLTVIEQYPVEEELVQIHGDNSVADSFGGYAASWSAEIGCGIDSTYTDGLPADSEMSQVRCLRFQINSFTQYGFPFLGRTRLRPEVIAALHPGESFNTSNRMLVSASNLANGETEVSPDGKWKRVSENHIWWNGQVLDGEYYRRPADWSPPGERRIYSILTGSPVGTNTHLSLTLPPGLDWRLGGPASENENAKMADGSQGTPSCTSVRAQAGAGGHPASLLCVLPGDVVDNWNEDMFVRLLAGYAGQSFNVCSSAWVEPASTAGSYELPYTAAHPWVRCVDLTFAGSQSIEVSSSVAPSSVMAGSEAVFALTTTATGQMGISGTHAYFYPGKGVDAAGKPVAFTDAQCQQPTLASIDSPAGAIGPGPIVDCTTDSPPAPDSTWAPCPGDLSLVTGVRATPINPYDASIGVLSPGDGPQTIELHLRAPDAAGQKLCMQGAATGDGLGVVTTALAKIDITWRCIMTCDAFATAMECNPVSLQLHAPQIDGCAGATLTNDYQGSQHPTQGFNVTWTMTAADGQVASTCTTQQPLVDTHSPTVSCGAPVHVPFTGAGMTYLPGASASDSCDGSIAATCAVATFAAPGSQTVSCGAQDAAGHQATPCNVEVIADARTTTCDSVLYLPGLGEHGRLLYEDLWPSAGDNDFNDLVLTYNFAVTGADGAITGLQGTFNVLAVGAKFHSSVNLHLPGVGRDAASFIEVRTPGGAATHPAAADGEDDLVIKLIGDSLELFGRDSFINTDPAQPAVPGKPLTVLIRFNPPLPPGTLDLAKAPFDTYIALSSDPGHQIHRMHYSGTKRMNTALFGTHDDRSDAGRNAGLHFVGATGRPWVLDLPASAGAVHWPKEKVEVSYLYPQITPWAESGGLTDTEWYLDVNHLTHAWTGGSNNTLPPTPRFVGAADGTTDLTPTPCVVPQ